MKVHVEWLDGETVDFDDVMTVDLSRSGTVITMRRRLRVPAGPQSYTFEDINHSVPLTAVRWWTEVGR